MSPSRSQIVKEPWACPGALVSATRHHLAKLLFCSLLLPGTGMRASPPPIVVSGIVVDEMDSRPIEGAFVVLESRREAANHCAIVGARTAQDGRFALPAASCSEFDLFVEKPGFLSLTRRFGESEPGMSAAGRLPLKSSEQLDDIRLHLIRQSTVAGRVTDSDNQPLVGAVVQLSKVYAQGWRSYLSTVTQATTNDLGEYRIFGLRPGRYYVGAYYHDQGSRLGLRKQALQGNRSEASEVYPKDYAVTYYPWGSDPKNATVLALRPGEVVGNIDIRIEMVRSYPVTGRVEGNPPGTMTSRVFLEPAEIGGLGPVRYSTPTPGTERFEFASVAPGHYRLRSETMIDGEMWTALENLIVGSSPVDDVVLSLQPSFSVAGFVSTDTGEAIPSGLQLRLLGLGRPFISEIKPDTSGRFETRVVGSDRYLIDANTTDGTTYVKSVTLDSQRVGVDGVIIGHPRQILRVVVSNKAGQIEGRVVDPDQRPVTSGLVVLAPANFADPSVYSTPVRPDGGFEIESLPPGKYRVSAFSDLGALSDATWDIQKRVRTSGHPFEVSESERKQLSVEATQADP